MWSILIVCCLYRLVVKYPQLTMSNDVLQCIMITYPYAMLSSGPAVVVMARYEQEQRYMTKYTGLPRSAYGAK